MQIEWTDATSYSQGQRGKVSQTAWETTICGARVWVSCGHRYYPDRWVMNCQTLGIKGFDLGSTNASSEQARDRAINKVWEAARIKAGEMTELADAAFAVSPLSN